MATTTKTVHNFNAGPAVMPLPALERARAEWLDFAGTGMSVMEVSHRGKPYIALQAEAEALVRELLAVPAGYQVLFLQGGASHQFAMLPMNFLPAGRRADYIVTGEWATKALKEAQRIGEARAIATSEASKFDHIPKSFTLAPDAAYVHLTSNNTIFGTQWQDFPDTGSVPLVADMSSDIMWRPIDVSRFGLIYAGAQKNLGPAGVTLVIVREDWLATARTDIAAILGYQTHAKAGSMFNTPPTLAIYMLRNVLSWIKDGGGLAALEAQNRNKAALVYGALDRHPAVYTGHAQIADRSAMNLTFRLADDAAEKAFLALAEARGFVGLAGHRSVGGCRASMYNALPEASAQALADLLDGFASAGSK